MTDDHRCMQCAAPTMKHLASYADFAAAARQAPDERQRLHAYMEAHPEAQFTEFLACLSCGFVQVSPVPSPDTLIAFYQNYYASQAYARKRDKKIKRTRKRLNNLRRYISGGRFLDVGCNVGFAVEAARLSGFEGTGIEIDANAVAYANEHFAANRYIATTIEDFFPDAPFDLVHCTEVIEHVTSPVLFVQHLARLTKPGGYLFLTTPDAGHWRVPRNFVDWPEVKPLEHINWQTRHSIRQLLVAHGFDSPHIAFNLKPGLKLVAQRL